MAIIERWKPVVGFEGLYEVSDQGRVRSLDRLSSSGSKLKGSVKKTPPNSHGYLIVSLYKNGMCTSCAVHKLVLEAFVGPRPKNMAACHYNDIKIDNRLENLRWDTLSANQYDRIRNGNNHRSNQSLCFRGHLLQPFNYVPSEQKRGKRACRSCMHAHQIVRSHPELESYFDIIADSYYKGCLDAQN